MIVPNSVYKFEWYNMCASLLISTCWFPGGPVASSAVAWVMEQIPSLTSLKSCGKHLAVARKRAADLINVHKNHKQLRIQLSTIRVKKEYS